MDLTQIQSVYFLGIGGIGMSAMARYFHDRGVHVSGYDKTPSEITVGLQEEGIKIHFDEDPQQLPSDIQLAVYTPAIPSTSALLQHLRKGKTPLVKRAEILGAISRQTPCIAVAGTHGKTSICTMLTHILKTANIPTEALLGGISVNYNTNYIGDKKPRWLVTEADEFDRSFLHLEPELAIITSMDADHLDIYGTAGKLVEAFMLFAGKIKPGGTLLIKKGLDCPQGFRGQCVTYGLDEGADYHATNIEVLDGRFVADFGGPLRMTRLIFGTPGRHNIENALGAAAIAHMIGVKEEDIRRGMATCEGVKRRFDIRHKSSHTVYIDDYAHHPGELDACIQTARELYPGRKITGVFQPHLFSRTRDLAGEFAQSLALLDEVLLLDIYPAREAPIEGVSAGMLLNKIPGRNKKLVPRNELLNELKKRDIEILITMGAGDIDRLAGPIVEMLIRRENK
ncbi:MAG: UDP-N-acetylmuramate--L-alanine ligase [Bacteroidales bacterium]